MQWMIRVERVLNLGRKSLFWVWWMAHQRSLGLHLAVVPWGEMQETGWEIGKSRVFLVGYPDPRQGD